MSSATAQHQAKPHIQAKVPTVKGHFIIIGAGAVTRAILPYLSGTIIVIDERPMPAYCQGVSQFIQQRVTVQSYQALLTALIEKGSIILNLASNVSSLDLTRFAQKHSCHYIDCALYSWNNHDPLYVLYDNFMRERTSFANNGPTAILSHGTNPGLVSHFWKKALSELAACPFTSALEKTTLQGILILETDSQKAELTHSHDTQYMNTWNPETFHIEYTSPTESLTQRPLAGAIPSATDPRRHYVIQEQPNMITIQTQQESWSGRAITHEETFTIYDYIFQATGQDPIVRFVYQPCAIALECAQTHSSFPTQGHILTKEIASGSDRVGTLVITDKGSWWVGYTLDISEARYFHPDINATTWFVAVGLLPAIRWLQKHPQQGLQQADDLPHDAMLQLAMDYIKGPLESYACQVTTDLHELVNLNHHDPTTVRAK